MLEPPLRISPKCFNWWLSGKESACNRGAMEDMGSIRGWGNTLEEETATHSSILAWRIPKDRGVWWATP